MYLHNLEITHLQPEPFDRVVVDIGADVQVGFQRVRDVQEVTHVPNFWVLQKMWKAIWILKRNGDNTSCKSKSCQILTLSSLIVGEAFVVSSKTTKSTIIF